MKLSRRNENGINPGGGLTMDIKEQLMGLRAQEKISRCITRSVIDLRPVIQTSWQKILVESPRTIDMQEFLSLKTGSR